MDHTHISQSQQVSDIDTFESESFPSEGGHESSHDHETAVQEQSLSKQVKKSICLKLMPKKTMSQEVIINDKLLMKDAKKKRPVSCQGDDEEEPPKPFECQYCSKKFAKP